MALIILEWYLLLPSINNSNAKDWFLRTALQIIIIWSKSKQPRCRRTKPWTSSTVLLPRTNDQSCPYSLNCVCACMRLLFLSRSSRHGYCLRAATIWGMTTIWINTLVIQHLSVTVSNFWQALSQVYVINRSRGTNSQYYSYLCHIIAYFVAFLKF